MNRLEIAKLYRDDLPAFMKLEDDDLGDLYCFEALAVQVIQQALPLLEEELKLLLEENPHNKEVKYINEVVEIEGVFYTFMHKLDIGTYFGYTSTSASLANMLKSADRALDKLMDELDTSEVPLQS